MFHMPERHVMEIWNGQLDKQNTISEKWSKMKIYFRGIYRDGLRSSENGSHFLRSEESKRRKEKRQDYILRNSSFWRSRRELATEAGREQDSVVRGVQERKAFKKDTMINREQVWPKRLSTFTIQCKILPFHDVVPHNLMGLAEGHIKWQSALNISWANLLGSSLAIIRVRAFALLV